MLQRHAIFLDVGTHGHIISESLTLLFRRDRESKEWLDKASSGFPAERVEAGRRHRNQDHGKCCMIQRVLNSKHSLAIVLAISTGTFLYLKMPCPTTDSLQLLTWNEYFSRLIGLHDP